MTTSKWCIGISRSFHPDWNEPRIAVYNPEERRNVVLFDLTTGAIKRCYHYKMTYMVVDPSKLVSVGDDYES